ncbi:MAG: hypothetical protein JW951_01605 [Lentisphaerae bacterium]|nr:hypothetical protein [Lentisphaerota bacterium]
MQHARFHVACLCLAAGCGLASGTSGGSATFHSGRLPYPERTVRIGFWLGCSDNAIFTPEVVEWIGQRASFVVLNAAVKGPHPYFDYTNCVARLKAANPAMPVLFYRYHHMFLPTPRTGGLFYEDVRRHPEWALCDKAGRPIRPHRHNASRLPDITLPACREAALRSTMDAVARLGVDGVAFDMYHRSLSSRHAEAAGRGDAFTAAWAQASEDYLRRLRFALPDGKLVLINGLWPMRDGLLADQAKLLNETDAAAVEYFGYYVHPPRTPEDRDREFARYVLDILDVMESHPDLIYGVYARSRRYVYLGYEEDYLVQRYGLGCFLLGMTPLSTFKYHSHFQLRSGAHGRTWGLSYYADYDLDLGAPSGRRYRRDGLWMRRYDKGLVVVAPSAQGDRIFTPQQKGYTPEGETVEGDWLIPEGRALIVLAERPPAPPGTALEDRFESGAPNAWWFPVGDADTGIVREGGRSFLRLRRAGDAVQPWHERRIQPVRRLVRKQTLSFDIRTRDTNAVVLLRVEVDDLAPAPVIEDAAARKAPYAEDRRRPYAVVCLQPAENGSRRADQGPDIPYGQAQAGYDVPYLTGATPRYRADGQWHRLDVDTETLFHAAGRHLKPRRIPSIRVLGEVDLDEIVLRQEPARFSTPGGRFPRPVNRQGRQLQPIPAPRR